MNINRVGYTAHIGVMKNEISSILKDVPKGYFIDATYGYGSHYETILNFNHLHPIGFDRDIEAVNNRNVNHKVIHSKFSNIYEYLQSNSLSPISGILYDLGVSSHQINSSYRGFSYTLDDYLDMRMNQKDPISVLQVVNEYSYEKLHNIFSNYGEERYSKKIAKILIDKRPIYKTKELTEIIKIALPKQNPIFTEKSIRKVFQALRIYVNDELNELEESLEKIKTVIKKNGVIVCISYHSLEDKIVKNFMKDLTLGCICEPSIAICVCSSEKHFKFANKKKFFPEEEEITKNSRAKSAILRYVIKL